MLVNLIYVLYFNYLISFKEIHRMAGTSEDVTVRMKKNVLSWFGHVERMSDERTAKKIYDEKVSGKRGRGDFG